jgi:hypothetical protein
MIGGNGGVGGVGVGGGVCLPVTHSISHCVERGQEKGLFLQNDKYL